MSVTKVRYQQVNINQITTHSVLNYVDLRNLQLGAVDISGSDWSHSLLSGINLEGAQLIGCSFYATDLTNAILRNVNADCCCFSNSVMHGVDLTGANLRGVSFFNTDLTQTHIGGIVVSENTWFDHCKITESQLLMLLLQVNLTQQQLRDFIIVKD